MKLFWFWVVFFSISVSAVALGIIYYSVQDKVYETKDLKTEASPLPTLTSVQSLLTKVPHTKDRAVLILEAEVEEIITDNPNGTLAVKVKSSQNPNAHFLVELGSPKYEIFVEYDEPQEGGTLGESKKAEDLIEKILRKDEIVVKIGFPGGGMEEFEKQLLEYENRLKGDSKQLDPFTVPYYSVESIIL